MILMSLLTNLIGPCWIKMLTSFKNNNKTGFYSYSREHLIGPKKQNKQTKKQHCVVQAKQYLARFLHKDCNSSSDLIGALKLLKYLFH